jgi:uncharacterized phage protein gp47/JayE
MQLQLQTFASLVSAAAASVQGSARQLIDLSVGSTLRAVLEASASVGLWMQWLTLQVLRMTRAASSEGADLDSWVADFGLTRLPGVAAQGAVTLSRFVPLSAALVPVGTELRTGDGAQSFRVVADPLRPTWSASQGGYVLGVSEAETTVPVVAVAVGNAGNVQAGAISLIAAALPGIDTVTNTAPLQNGLDAESDPALRARFRNFIDSRSRATPVAVGYAISAVQQGLQYTLMENQVPDGSARPGCFTVTVDDGSGAASDALLATVTTAIEAVRPVGSSFTVRRPAVVRIQISLTVDVSDPNAAATARQAVAAALTAYVNGLPIGMPLAWSRLTQVAYGAHAAVSNVRGVLLNGSMNDFDPGRLGVVKADSVTVG